jgi:hypothetical protein
MRWGYMGPGIAQNHSSYFRYPSRDLGTRTLPWTVGGRGTPSSQAYLTYPAKDVPKKHDIPLAINSE